MREKENEYECLETYVMFMSWFRLVRYQVDYGTIVKQTQATHMNVQKSVAIRC